jgi:uncharacterized protein YbjT (DUF2867 family)
MTQRERILVTGATGYVGGRLVPQLLERGYRVRVLVRDPARLQGRPWADRVEVVQGDVLAPESLPPALNGIDTAYYLIHGMRGLRPGGRNFAERDRAAARDFGRAAHDAGLGRIIYLGGLGDPEADLSEHLRSRQLTGDELRSSGVPVTEFRAAIIVGSGSASFEMIRYLTERLPVLVVPRGVKRRVQPIGIRNVIDYLVAALETVESVGRIIEIGGKDVLTYGDMLLGYARARKLRRVLLPLPILTPGLFVHWVYWATPISLEIARPLIDGLRNEVIVRDESALRLFPDIDLLDYETQLDRALLRLDAGRVATAWSDSLASSQGDAPATTLTSRNGMIVDRRQRRVSAPAKAVYRVFSGLGGTRGWPYLNAAWRLRGILDRLVGGVGFRRGRRDPDDLRVGDALDFFRVEAVEEGRSIRLRAEMKVPGHAWIQFEALPGPDRQTQLVQSAFFAPHGVFGHLYWYLLYPIHALIFAGTIDRIARKALAETETRTSSGPARRRSPSEKQGLSLFSPE